LNFRGNWGTMILLTLLERIIELIECLAEAGRHIQEVKPVLMVLLEAKSSSLGCVATDRKCILIVISSILQLQLVNT